MYSSKLLQVMGVLTQAELTALHKYLCSPFFYEGKKADELLRLFLHIQKCLPDLKHPLLQKEKVFHKIYEQEVVPGKLEKLMTLLYQSINRFIVEYQSNHLRTKNEALILLSNFFRERQLTNLEQINEKQFWQQQKKKQRPNTNYYEDNYLWYKAGTDFGGLHNPALHRTYLPDTLLSLDEYYVVTKLGYTCQLLAIDLFIASADLGASLELMEELEPKLAQDYFKAPLIRVYYRAYLLLRADEENRSACFANFREVLEQYEEQLPVDALNSLQALIRNYGIERYNRGDESYLLEVFGLYRDHLEKGFLYFDNQLMVGTLGNLVVFGLRAKAFDWVLELLESHRDRIARTTDPESIYRFYKAQYYFAIGELDTALSHLDTPLEGTLFKVAAKRLEIQIYYEMNSPLLDSRIDAFKIYIYRLASNQMSEKLKTANRNFIDLLKQIRQPATYQNSRRIQKLADKIESLPIIAEKEWMLEKLAARG